MIHDGNYYTEGFWDMQDLGISTEPFFIITQRSGLYREVLYNDMLGAFALKDILNLLK